MTRSPAPVCSWPSCSRKTREPGGRCFDHLAGYRRDFTGPVTPAPSLTASPTDLPTSVIRNGDGSVREERWRVGSPSHGVLSRRDAPAAIEYFSDGAIAAETYFLDGKRHREDGPAEIRYDPRGQVVEEVFYLHDEIHRDGAPARLRYFTDGELREEMYALHGVIGAGKEGPARSSWWPGGTRAGEHFFTDGVAGRPDAPSNFQYDREGRLIGEQYRTTGDGKVARLDGPARIRYGKDGTVVYEEWCLADKEHRLDGPARTSYDDQGVKRRGDFHFHGDIASPAEISMKLSVLDPTELRQTFEDSAYRPLLEAGATPEQVLEAYRAGLIAVEDVRAVTVEGVPIEWYRAWKEGPRDD